MPFRIDTRDRIKESLASLNARTPSAQTLLFLLRTQNRPYSQVTPRRRALKRIPIREEDYSCWFDTGY